MTTILVPASKPTIRKPDGDAGGCDDFAQTLYTAAGRLEEFGDEATQLRDLRSGWHGVAYDAYRTASGKASGEHSAMSTSVKRVGRAVTAYADTLRDHLREWEGLVDRKSTLDSDRDSLVTKINEATDPTPEEIQSLRQEAADLSGRYDTLVTDHQALHRRVRSNEDLLRKTFQAADSLDEALSDDGGVPDSTKALMGRPGAPGGDASPEETRQWWEGLSAAEREAVIAGYPGLIGDADGLPAGARDQANRILLDDDLATLQGKEDDGTISDSESDALDNAEKTKQALEDADAFTDPITGDHPGGQLWLYDPRAFDGDGQVAVSVGDLDHADDVAVFTPGIKTEMSDVTGYTGQMMNLYESSRFNGDGSSVATMFWLGYDAPSGATDTATMTEGRAEDGGERLADAVDGMRASRADDPAHMTAIGHSYGSTTTSYAAGEHELDVDDVALIGSPGAGPSDSADDFSVGEDHVYVGRDSRDLVAKLGDEGWVGKGGLGLGTDPSSEGFGATRFEAEDVDRSWHTNTSDAHSSYLNNDTESLYNLGRIVDGQGDDVNEADQSYDPWYGPAVDPEATREPDEDVPHSSDTTDRRDN